MFLLWFFIILFFLIVSALVLFSFSWIYSATETPAPEVPLFHEDETDLYTDQTLSTAPKVTQQAVVLCSPDRRFLNKRFEYQGTQDCLLFKMTYESDSDCVWGCIGFGSCIASCPQNAIKLINRTAVVTNACDGCGKCLSSCPNGLLRLIPSDAEYFVQCASHDKAHSLCSAACTGCGDCVDKINQGAVSIVDGLAHIDYSDERSKFVPAHVCKSKALKKLPDIEENSFKFWKLCYNMLKIKYVHGDSELWD